MKRWGRKSRKHSDVFGVTKEIYENFSQDLHSVMTNIQPGPSEYKLGIRSTQSDINFLANSDLSVTEVSSCTQTFPAILHSGAKGDIQRLLRSLFSDPGNIGLNYQTAAPPPPKGEKQQ